ncbi:MAG: hypothetical protein ACRD3W_08500, partial [Terriglobales bacterium]
MPYPLDRPSDLTSTTSGISDSADGKVFTGSAQVQQSATDAMRSDADLAKAFTFTAQRQSASDLTTGQFVVSANLNDVQIVNGSPAQTASLDAATIDSMAKQLRDALHSSLFFGFGHNPNVAKVMTLLSSLNDSDRQALIKTYADENGTPADLRQDLQNNLGDVDFQKAASLLDRTDGSSNDAGQLTVALAELKQDSIQGQDHLLDLFATLNSQQIAALDSQFRRTDAGGIAQAIAASNQISQSTKEELQILMKGSDQRTTADDVSIAKTAANAAKITVGGFFGFGGTDAGDPVALHALQLALGCDLPAGRQARQQLQGDQSFIEQMHNQFGDSQQVNDIISEGHISLATIANQDQGWILGIGKNTDNFELAVENATISEQQQFQTGQMLNQSHSQPTTPEEQAALDYYARIEKAMHDLGGDADVQKWEGELLGKGNGSTAANQSNDNAADQGEDLCDRIRSAITSDSKDFSGLENELKQL